MRSLQDKRIAFNFLFLSSPLQPSFMSPSQVKRRIIPDKMFLKKIRRPKTKLTNIPGKKNTGEKTKKNPGAKAPGFTNCKKKLTTPAKRLPRQYQLSHQRCSHGKGRSEALQNPGTQDRSPSSLPFLRISYSRCCRH